MILKYKQKKKTVQGSRSISRGERKEKERVAGGAGGEYAQSTVYAMQENNLI